LTKPAPSPVGAKVLRWLDRQREQGREPANPTALARVVGCDQKTVEHWTKHGRTPGGKWVPALAAVMGVDAAWLLDDTRRWPPTRAGRPFAALADTIPPEDQAALAPILSDPAERAAIIAADRARREARRSR